MEGIDFFMHSRGGELGVLGQREILQWELQCTGG
jgi:hypothetical protein